MGQELVQHLAEIVLAIGTVSFEVGTRCLQAFKKLCEYIDPTVNNVTQGMIDSLNEAAEATRDFILGITEHFNSLMDNGLETFFMNFADTFNKVITACAKTWTVFINSLDQLLDHIDPINNEFTQGLLDNMNKAIISVGDAFLGFADLVKSFAENGGNDLLNAIADIITAVLNLGARIVDVSAGALTELFEHLDPSKNQIAKNCIDSFTQFAEQIRNALGTIGNAVEQFMSAGGNEILKNLADIALLLGDLAVTLAGDIISGISAFFDSWAGQAVIQLAAAALELATKALKGLLEILNGPLAPLFEGLIAGFGALVVAQKVSGWIAPLVTIFQTLAAPGGALSLATSLISKLAAAFPLLANPVGLAVVGIAALAVGFVALYNNCEGFREVIDRIIDGFDGFVEAVKKNLLPIIDQIKEIFGNVIDIIVGIFEGDGEKVGEAVRNLVTNIVELFGQLTVAFVEVGWNLIKGLANGIWEAVKAIPDMLAGIGEFIIDFFKGLFGIHSPSTVFAGLGGFLIEGLAQGLGDMSLLTDTITGISDFLRDSFTSAKETVLGVFEGIGEEIGKKFDSVTEFVSEIAGNVKNAFNFEWKLPKLKTPSISWETKESSLGFKYPKFSVNN